MKRPRGESDDENDDDTSGGGFGGHSSGFDPTHSDTNNGYSSIPFSGSASATCDNPDSMYPDPSLL